jgi:hypothetical protein
MEGQGMTTSRESITSETTRRSRRMLLGGALGAIAAWAAGAVGRATPVRAEGEGIVVGGEYPTATSVTRIANSTNANDVFWAASTASGIGLRGSSDSYVGVRGSSGSHIGVYGTSSSFVAVWGSSGDDIGVYGASGSNVGVFGTSGGGDHPGILGRSGTGTAVQGVSGPSVKAKPKTGIFGYANHDSAAKGVWGQSPVGRAIQGTSSSGWAGYFSGRVFTERYIELAEISNPTAPGSNRARLFLRESSGKTQLCVRFHNGTIRVLASA